MKILAPVFGLLCALSCFGQAPAFDVASVRLHVEPTTGNPSQFTADSVTLRGISLQSCIQMAFEVPEARVVGPSWLKDVRVDIAAKMTPPADRKKISLMMQTLLGERMGVLAHLEKREAPVYVLTVGKDGPKFSESTTEGELSSRGQKGITVVQHATMDDLAMMLSGGLGRPFVNETGLKGRYDFRYDLNPYRQPGPEGPDSVMDAVSIMIPVLQEQLGLKVESRKASVDFLVIDHAEKTPTEN